MIEEREASKATALPAFPDRQHFWGVDGQLLFSEQGTVNVAKGWSALDERLYALRDALGSTTALSDGSFLRGRFSYQPYGEPRKLTNDLEPIGGKLWHDFDYLFAGYRYDHETGLYHTRARQYHPLLGVWNRRDPAGYMDGMNLYGYVAGSPATLVDPTGEAALLIGALIVGAVAIAGTGIYVAVQAANSDDPGEVYSAAGRGVGAGGATVGDTFTFGLTPLGDYRDELYDELGVTGTWADYGSRYAAVAARESLIAAATLGLGNYISAGVQGSVGLYRAGRVTQAALTTYEYGMSAHGLVTGVQELRAGNPWGLLNIGLSAAHLGVSVNGVRAQTRAIRSRRLKLNVFGEGEAPAFLDVSTEAVFANGRRLTETLPSLSAKDILIRYSPISGARNPKTLREIVRLARPGTRITLNQATPSQSRILLEAFKGRSKLIRNVRVRKPNALTPGDYFDANVLQFRVTRSRRWALWELL